MFTLKFNIKEIKPGVIQMEATASREMPATDLEKHWLSSLAEHVQKFKPQGCEKTVEVFNATKTRGN